MIRLVNASVRLAERFTLPDINWTINHPDVWAVVGPNGSGKSALVTALASGELMAGTRDGLPARVGVVSLEAQRALIERERERDDSDITDEVFTGTPLGEILDELCEDQPLQSRLISELGLDSMLARGFRKLSTGETRKAMLIRALTSDPGFLILDEPFEGLDAQVTPVIRDILAGIAGRVPMVLVFNRLDEIPDFATHIAYLEDCRIRQTAARDDGETWQWIRQLFHLKTADLDIPAPDPADRVPSLDPEQPLFRLTRGTVRFGDNTVFEDLTWQIDPGVHWQVTGPNGSGKTCLLNLITGDNPQCYNNDIRAFGFQRGSGESIWDIKQHIGYVSSGLQWDYRVSVSVRNAIISGFYDSIGLYAKPTDVQQQVADAWLRLLGLAARAGAPFRDLSYGDQRLVLIARAMVKHPHLLILDEPCIGLDDINRQLVLALIEKICAGSGTTVIYVNHHREDKIHGIEKFLALGDGVEAVSR